MLYDFTDVNNNNNNNNALPHYSPYMIWVMTISEGNHCTVCTKLNPLSLLPLAGRAVPVKNKQRTVYWAPFHRLTL